MGAITTINRKRADECLSLHTPSPSFNSPHYFYDRSNQIDTHIAKKPRISNIQSAGKLITSAHSVVPRLRQYPEPGKLRREVHAPCRRKGFGLLSGGLKCEDSGIQEKVDMGNTLNKILRKYAEARDNAVSVLRYVGKDKEVIDVEDEPEKEDVISKGWGEVEIVEDGNEIQSVVSDGNRVPEGVEAPESGAIQAASVEALDLTNVENAAKVFGSMSLGFEAYKKLLHNVDAYYSPRLSSLDSEIKLTEAQLQFHQSLKKQEELKKPGEDLLREPFVVLSEEEEREVARAFSNSNRRKILVTHENSNIQITGEMLQCLKPGAWLNDEVINVYLELLKERERREPKKFLNCHFFNTFFYKKLIGGRNGYDYKAVRRWTTQKKLGYGLVDCDKIFVPIHKEVHWCLAVINKKDKSFQYLDSLGGRDFQVLRVLARYFADEMKDKSGQEIDVGSWELEFVEDLPEQQNGFDCGVFMIKYADFYSRGMGLHFSQENMPYFRLRTAKEILRLRAD